MNINEFGRRLDEINEVYGGIIENPVSVKVVSKEEQTAMRERIMALFDLYEKAIDEDTVYVPNVRKEINSILHTLEKWIEYDELHYAKMIMRFLPYAFNFD